MSEVRYNSLLHRTAQLTMAATLLLIFMGGLVTSHGAGMSVPDWPNTYGYNMFTFPPSKWIGGIFYEHTHRLMGTVVGMLSIVLTVVAWKVESRRWVRWLAAAVLGAVIFQGVLGGLRVVWVELKLAVVHACAAQAFLCLAALVAVVTSRWWLSARDTGFQPVPGSGHGLKARVTYLAFACCVLIYFQLIVGALMRHYEAGLAIPDLPLHYGQVLPPTNEASLQLANQQRVAMHLPPVTLAQVWLHFGHRIGAIIVSVLIIWTATVALSRQAAGALRRPALALIILLVTQLTLGVLTVLLKKPADIASLHVAVGALTLMTVFVLLVRSIRVQQPRPLTDEPHPQGVLIPA